jgi:enoyl-CoA hydratase/carnithine racemase
MVMTKAIRKFETGTDELICEVRDNVAVITLNRPHARNSLSDNLSPALRTMIARCGEDAEVGAVMITGTGAAFCSGGDVKGMGDNASRKEMSPEEKVALLRDRQRRLTGALVSLRKPTIAALPGPAAAAGLSIALACDLRIAAESAFVSTGYAKVGLSGDYGISWLLTRLIGPARARELMFTSEKVDARRCEALGLVNRVVPDDQVRQAAFDLALTLAHGPVEAYALMKENLDEALLTDFHTALDGEAERMVRSAGSADHREAVAAFIAKRTPRFSRESDRQG